MCSKGYLKQAYNHQGFFFTIILLHARILQYVSKTTCHDKLVWSAVSPAPFKMRTDRRAFPSSVNVMWGGDSRIAPTVFTLDFHGIH